MSESFKFTTVDGKFEMSVKSTFLKVCEKPSEVKLMDLLTVHRVNQYFHNTTGPAITRKRDNYMEYWLDGKKVSEEEGKRIEHEFNFNNKVMSIISDSSNEVV